MADRLRLGWRVNRYLWLTLLFVGAYLPYAAAQGRLSIPLAAAYGLFALGVANGALRTYSAWKLGGWNDERRGWLFNIVDIGLIALAVRVTGSVESDLWLLYFVVLVSEALYTRRRETRLLLAALAASYLAATWPYGRALDANYALTAAARVFFLYLVGEFARQLTEIREERNHELALLREQVATGEERARIAREVHDGLGHALVAVILRLELCSRLIGRDPAQAERILGEEVPALRAAWNQGRDLAFHLRPWGAGDGRLCEGIRAQIARFAQRTGIVVEVETPEDEPELAPAAAMAIAGAVQEALTNVARHSRAGRAWVRVEHRGDRLCVVVDDDGVGPSERPAGTGEGLLGMGERTRAVGGSFHFGPRPEAGARVVVTVPTSSPGGATH